MEDTLGWNRRGILKRSYFLRYLLTPAPVSQYPVCRWEGYNQHNVRHLPDLFRFLGTRLSFCEVLEYKYHPSDYP